MAVNFASKASPKVLKRFTVGSFTDNAFSKDYDFVGVKTLRVYTNDVVELGNYNRSGTGDRYGTANELGDTYQEMTMTQDKSFTYTIDKGNASDQLNIKKANSTLKENIDTVVIPAVDQYRFGVLADGAGLKTGDTTLSTTNVIRTIMLDLAKMSNALVPKKGRIIWIKETAYVECKMAQQVTGNDKLGEAAISRGVVGYISGAEVVPVPDSYLPASVNYIIFQKSGAIAPVKVKDYKIHVDPPGVSGNKVEFRMYHDCFVLDTHKNAILVNSTAAAT